MTTPPPPGPFSPRLTGVLFVLVLVIVLLGLVIFVPLLAVSYQGFRQATSGFCQLTDPVYQALQTNAEGWTAQGTARRFSVAGSTQSYLFQPHFSGAAQTPVFFVITQAAPGSPEGAQGYIVLRAGSLPPYWRQRYAVQQIAATIFCYQRADL